jgi:hypothetical protein
MQGEHRQHRALLCAAQGDGTTIEAGLDQTEKTNFQLPRPPGL